MCSLLRNLVLVAVTAENRASQRQDVENGSRFFRAFVAILGYSSLTLIQNVWRFEVVSNILLRPPSFSISSQSFSSMDKVSPCLFTNTNLYLQPSPGTSITSSAPPQIIRHYILIWSLQPKSHACTAYSKVHAPMRI